MFSFLLSSFLPFLNDPCVRPRFASMRSEVSVFLKHLIHRLVFIPPHFPFSNRPTCSKAVLNARLVEATFFEHLPFLRSSGYISEYNDDEGRVS